MRITFYGAAGVVTGSCFLVEAAGHRLLVDCGLFQGTKALQERNYGAFPFAPASIEAVLLTHAHIDHSGLLPKLVREGFAGPIYATAPTADLLRIMLPDSAHIQESEVERLNRRRARRGEPPLQPIYTRADAERAHARVRPVPFDRPFRLFDGVDADFTEAGHVLGAAIITVTEQIGGERVRVAFTGDLGPAHPTLIAAPKHPGNVDAVVMESTYGDRDRIGGEDRYEQLAAIVRDTFARGGNVVIPSFAIGRTQEILYGLHRMVRSGELDPGRIFVDSPLAVEATEIFCTHVESFDIEARRFAAETEECPLYLRELTLSRTAEESKAINNIRSGAVIISAAGMCEAGRIKHHLRHNLWRPECSIVFVGYQAEGTLGRRIQRGDPVVRIHGEEVRVRAAVYSLDGFSAHADQEELIGWVAGLSPKPRHVYLVHGEESARSALKELLWTRLGIPASTPLLGDTVEVTPKAVAQLAAGEAPNGSDQRIALWHAADELRRLIDQLQSQAIDPDLEHRLFAKVEEALALARAARSSGRR